MVLTRREGRGEGGGGGTAISTVGSVCRIWLVPLWVFFTGGSTQALWGLLLFLSVYVPGTFEGFRAGFLAQISRFDVLVVYKGLRNMRG